MKMEKIYLSFILISLLASSVANAEELPKEKKNVHGEVLSSIQLPSDFDLSTGRILRMREVTIAPDGALPMHNHKNRPSVSYVLKGTLTEYQEGSTTGKEIHAGESYSSFGSHALLNKTNMPAVFLEVDLFKKDK